MDEGIIRCICKNSDDDGFTIQCDNCSVWQHIACVNIVPDELPDTYLCEECDPRELDVARAIEIQSLRVKVKETKERKPKLKGPPKAPPKAPIKGPIKGSPRKRKESLVRKPLGQVGTPPLKKNEEIEKPSMNIADLESEPFKRRKRIWDEPLEPLNSYETEYSFCVSDFSLVNWNRSLVKVMECVSKVDSLNSYTVKAVPQMLGSSSFGLFCTGDFEPNELLIDLKGVLSSLDDLDAKNALSIVSVNEFKSLLPPLVFPLLNSFLDCRDCGNYDGRFVRSFCGNNGYPTGLDQVNATLVPFLLESKNDSSDDDMISLPPSQSIRLGIYSTRHVKQSEEIILGPSDEWMFYPCICENDPVAISSCLLNKVVESYEDYRFELAENNELGEEFQVFEGREKARQKVIERVHQAEEKAREAILSVRESTGMLINRHRLVQTETLVPISPKSKKQRWTGDSDELFKKPDLVVKEEDEKVEEVPEEVVPFVRKVSLRDFMMQRSNPSQSLPDPPKEDPLEPLEEKVEEVKSPRRSPRLATPKSPDKIQGKVFIQVIESIGSIEPARQPSSGSIEPTRQFSSGSIEATRQYSSGSIEPRQPSESYPRSRESSVVSETGFSYSSEREPERYRFWERLPGPPSGPRRDEPFRRDEIPPSQRRDDMRGPPLFREPAFRRDELPRRMDDGLSRRMDEVPPRRMDEMAPRRMEDMPRRMDDISRRMDEMAPRRMDEMAPRRMEDGPRRMDEMPRRMGMEDGPPRRMGDEMPRRIGMDRMDEDRYSSPRREDPRREEFDRRLVYRDSVPPRDWDYGRPRPPRFPGEPERFPRSRSPSPSLDVSPERTEFREWDRPHWESRGGFRGRVRPPLRGGFRGRGRGDSRG